MRLLRVCHLSWEDCAVLYCLCSWNRAADGVLTYARGPHAGLSVRAFTVGKILNVAKTSKKF